MKKTLLYLFTILNGLTWADLDLEQFCLDKNLNEVAVHPEDCRGYIMCSKEPTVQYCEMGFHFDIKGLVCNWPEKVNCQLSSRVVGDGKDSVKPLLTTLIAFDIVTGEVIDPMLAYDPLNVVCRHFGAYFLPDPQQCRSYYLCAYGHMHKHACGPHTLWDYKTQQCVLSHNAVCYNYNQEEEMEINVDLENISMVCYPVNNTNTSTETVLSNSAYITSINVNTATTLLPTPPTKPMTPGTTKKPNSSNPYNITCPVKRQSYVAHPQDCSKYFMCIKGTAVMTSCPEGLLWDAKNEYCENRENVKCYQDEI